MVGARFLPFYRICFPPACFYSAIVIPVTERSRGLYGGRAVVCLASAAFDTVVGPLLCLENKRTRISGSAAGKE